MSTATEPTPKEPTPKERLHTIGAVCERLRSEFPDISISKIRYLEDQGLLRPRRTRGGYRLFSESDVERLATILRLQRDEFLPLRVIRDALETRGTSQPKRRRPTLVNTGAEVDLAGFCERAGITPDVARRLEEYDLVSPRIEAGERIYKESDVEIAAACGLLARHGLDARHLRAFRTAAGRQSALLEQLVATGLRSRDLERRRAALDELQTLAGVAIELAQHLLVRDLREASER
jgi:DNA-binding transcriptional MerR regulator